MKALSARIPPLDGNLEAGEIIVSRPHETAEKKALEAYQIADSMMRQRERTASGL
jgi:hypothetical protein